MKRVLVAALLCSASFPAVADGSRVSLEPFQSKHAWQVNYEDLIQRGITAGAQWQCRDNGNCDMYFIVKPGVKVHLAQERYGNGYCYIVQGNATADCYRQDGKKSVWTLDKPFEYGLPTPTSDTTPAPARDYAPTITANNAVPFTMVKNSIVVRVQLPGYWANMVLDTGATMGQVVQSLADKLIADGHASILGVVNVTMANGSTHKEQVIVIDSISIGTHTVRNVKMTIVADGADMLLGLPVLNAIGKFTIDAAKGELTFG